MAFISGIEASSEGSKSGVKCVRTLSPGWKSFTFDPTASTIPAPSEPGTMCGVRIGPGARPCAKQKCQSAPILPQLQHVPVYPWYAHLGDHQVSVVQPRCKQLHTHFIFPRRAQRSISVQLQRSDASTRAGENPLRNTFFLRFACRFARSHTLLIPNLQCKQTTI